MRPQSLAFLTLLLGLVLGGGAGFLFGSTQSGQVTAAAPMLVVDSTDPAPSGESDAAPDDAGLAQPTGLSSPTGEAAGDDLAAQASAIEAKAARISASVAARAAAEVSAAVDPSWTGVIRGEVVDENGQPIAGATVVTGGIQSWYDGRVTAGTTEKVGRAYPGRPPLDEQLMESAKRLEKARLTLPVAVSDDGGQFVLESLEPGTHSIRAYAEGYVFTSARVATGSPARLMGSGVGVFSLDVRLPDGTAPADAFVFKVDGDGNESPVAKWTPGEPELRLGSTRMRVRVMSGSVRSYEYAKHTGEFASEPFGLDAESDAGVKRVVELTELTQLRIAVKDESSALPHVEPWVKLVAAAEEGGVAPMKLERRRGGPFIAANLAVGTYEVQAGRGTSAPESTVEVEVVEGMNEIEVVLGDIDSSSFIVLTCVDSEGRPVGDVDFRYQVQKGNSGGSSSGGLSRLDQHPGGEYWVGWDKVLRDRYSREDVTVMITASTGAFGVQTKEVGPSGRVDFTFEEPCDLTVEVANAPAGKLQISTFAMVESPSGEESTSRRDTGSAMVNGQGRASIGKLQPGRYKVAVKIQKSEWQFSSPVAEEIVTLPPGETTIQITCPDVHELVILAPDMEAGTDIHLQKVSLTEEYGFVSAGHATLDSDGRAVFSGLADGDYLLISWSGGETQQMEVSVPSGPVTFSPMEINGYVVVSVAPDKAGQRAGLQVGDVVVGSGSGPGAGNPLVMNRCLLDMAEGATELKVQRGGREISIQVEALSGSAGGWQALGINWRPTSLGR